MLAVGNKQTVDIYATDHAIAARRGGLQPETVSAFHGVKGQVDAVAVCQLQRPVEEDNMISRQPQVVTAGTAEPIRIYNIQIAPDSIDIGDDFALGGILSYSMFEVAHPWPGETSPDARRARIAALSCSDLDGDGVDELIVHRVAASSGSCVMRCADYGLSLIHI